MRFANNDEAVMRRMHRMSRIDPLRGRLPRRDLLKLTGAAAGAAALGNLTGPGVLPARGRAGPPGRGERDRLRRRHRHRRARPAHDRHAGRLHRRRERLRLPGALRPRRDHDPARAGRVVGDLGGRAGLHLQPAPGRQLPRRRAVQRRRRRDLVQLDRRGGAGLPVRRHPHGLHRGLHHRPGSTRSKRSTSSRSR